MREEVKNNITKMFSDGLCAEKEPALMGLIMGD
jgi:hypothetical protein